MIKNHTFVCFDFETGGIDKKNNHHATNYAITEVGMVAYDMNFEHICEYRDYIKGQKINDVYVGYDPDLKYSQEALRYTAITIETLENKGVDYKKVVKNIVEVFKQADAGARYKKPILVGHNVAYDIPFLLYLFAYAKVDISKYVAGYFDHHNTFQPTFLDTMYMSRISDPYNRLKHSLGDACKRADIELFDAHTALADTKATAKLHKWFTLRMRSGSIEAVETKVEKRTRNHFSIES
tara:strand:+ start:1671 stop:2384 length:714 start_codon:yes stop_codon:yes gene_type:complete